MADVNLYILDDEPDMSNLIADVANMAELNAKSFTDPLDAWVAIEVEKPDFLVLDLVMPNMDGVEFVANMADAGYTDVELILISGTAKNILNSCEQVASQRNMSVIATLSKPFSVKAMIELFEQLKTAKAQAKQEVTREDSSAISMEDGKLIAYYQPQVEMVSGEIIGFEALARLEHAWLGIVPPARFIPEVEDSKSMEKLTKEVIHDVFTNIESWNSAGTYPIALNISPSCAASNFLPKLLETYLDQYNVAAKDIVLELTETAVMHDLVDSVETLTRMRLKGFQLSIDDFGTGTSSLEKLHQIPFSELKIDRSFVSRLLSSDEARAIIEASIMLAHRLGLIVVAEGVEDEQTFKMVASLGCDRCQGYFVAKPMPVDEVHAWIPSWKARFASLHV